jgi:hypothetical protein
MPPIASLVFAMKKERDEKQDQYKFVQKTIKKDKDIIRKGKVALAIMCLVKVTPQIPISKYLTSLREAQGCRHLLF